MLRLFNAPQELAVLRMLKCANVLWLGFDSRQEKLFFLECLWGHCSLCSRSPN